MGQDFGYLSSKVALAFVDPENSQPTIARVPLTTQRNHPERRLAPNASHSEFEFISYAVVGDGGNHRRPAGSAQQQSNWVESAPGKEMLLLIEREHHAADAERATAPGGLRRWHYHPCALRRRPSRALHFFCGSRLWRRQRISI